MKVIDYEQRSEGWYAARLGVPTASSFAKLITSTGKRATSADAYINELIAERLTGQSKVIPTTYAMQHGIDHEPAARYFYEFMTERKVKEVGLCLHDEMAAGASPDGLIGEDGLLEIKCPQAAIMVKYLRDQKLPTDYKAQVQGQMWITGRSWCDFVAYHPDMKSMIVRVDRDEKYIESLAEIVSDAVMSIETETNKLR